MSLAATPLKPSRERFVLSLGQRKIWDDWPHKHDRYLAVAGEQGGKTSLGGFWTKRLVKLDQRANYIVGAPTYKVLEQATKPELVKRFKGLGIYHEQDEVLQLDQGGKIYVRSSKDPDSVIGITNCKGAWIDEGGKCSRHFYYNILSRIARCGGPVLITTTPYALNWVKKELIDASEQESSILYSRWRSIDNPSYPSEQYERLRAILPQRVFRMRLEGFHDKAEGLIFEDWGDSNWIEPFTLPQDMQYYGGIDWGFDHPFALTVRGITKTQCYGVSIFKKSGLSVTQQLDLIASKTQMFHVKHWFCGHDRPDMISELQRRGIPATNYFAHNPGYREVNAGNQKHAELIKTKQYRVFKGIDQWRDLEDEYETYVWDKDELDEDRTREKPKDNNDDLMAAERYCTVGTIHLLTVKIEKVRIPIGLAYKKDRFDPRKSRREGWDSY